MTIVDNFDFIASLTGANHINDRLDPDTNREPNLNFEDVPNKHEQPLGRHNKPLKRFQ